MGSDTITYVDLFAGVGGLSLGFEKEDFENVFSIDFDRDACKTYRRNFPDNTMLEKDIKNIDGIKKIKSTSTNGISNITVEFENNVDMTKALSDIKDKVDKVSLPSDAETPMAQDISTNNEMMFSVIIYGDAKKTGVLKTKEYKAG